MKLKIASTGNLTAIINENSTDEDKEVAFCSCGSETQELSYCVAAFDCRNNNLK